MTICLSYIVLILATILSVLVFQTYWWRVTVEKTNPPCQFENENKKLRTKYERGLRKYSINSTTGDVLVAETGSIYFVSNYTYATSHTWTIRANSFEFVWIKLLRNELPITAKLTVTPVMTLLQINERNGTNADLNEARQLMYVNYIFGLFMVLVLILSHPRNNYCQR